MLFFCHPLMKQRPFDNLICHKSSDACLVRIQKFCKIQNTLALVSQKRLNLILI
jgi:hypothetical protein